ncbi:hypothetical protein C3K47_17490 [Solitalea longa]|uniref:Transferase n=1 Tax=Solitalea longa TaxID=2079460 RepID=A0A2S4ZYA4_9SPHI|nr:acyltransferase [Solitalea longa]POY34977.1 hypothetical protein C3K47_17490 [Solitalea longa]
MELVKILKKLNKVTLKSIYFNFKYLSLKQAVKLPFLISNKVYLLKAKGKVLIEGEIKPGMIEIGYGNVGIFDKKKSRSIWDVEGIVLFKGKANIGHGSKISVGENGTLIMGENFKISAESTIISSKKIEFGNACLLSWDVLIMDTDFHKIKDDNNLILNSDEEIRIGNNVWIGCRSLILKGSIISNNSVIAANTIVKKKINRENIVIGGNPIRILKDNITWEH